MEPSPIECYMLNAYQDMLVTRRFLFRDSFAVKLYSLIAFMPQSGLNLIAFMPKSGLIAFMPQSGLIASMPQSGLIAFMPQSGVQTGSELVLTHK